MKIKYLGTAAAEGIPALFCNCPVCKRAKELGGRDIRTRSQALIDDVLLVDFPPDTYLHMLRDGFDLSAVRSLLITHSHSDHFNPSDIFMRTNTYAHDPAEPRLNVYGGRHVFGQLRQIRNGQSEDSGAVQRLALYEVRPYEPVEIDGYKVTPLPATHMEGQEEQALIYIIEKGGKTLLYGNDTGFFSEEVWDALAGRRFDAVSLDSTLGPKAPYSGHMDLERNLRTRLRMLDMGCTGENTRFIVVHFSHNAGLNHGELVREAEKLGFEAAYDGMEALF